MYTCKGVKFLMNWNPCNMHKNSFHPPTPKDVQKTQFLMLFRSDMPMLLDTTCLNPDRLIKGALNILHAMTDFGAGGVVQYKLLGHKLGQAPFHSGPAYRNAFVWDWSYSSLQQIQPL